MVVTRLYHCRHCDADKPYDEMRKDRRMPGGVRPQCLDCRRKSESNYSGKSKAERAESKRAHEDAQDKHFTCIVCEEPKSYNEMSKDSRKISGVGARCLGCRRLRENQLRGRRREVKPVPEPVPVRPNGHRHLSNDWVFCWKCNAKYRPDALMQLPRSVALRFPDNEEIWVCRKCLDKIVASQEGVVAERRRAGLAADASRQEVVSRARMEAAKMLIEAHTDEYRRNFEDRLTKLGGEMTKRWVTL